MYFLKTFVKEPPPHTHTHARARGHTDTHKRENRKIFTRVCMACAIHFVMPHIAWR